MLSFRSVRLSTPSFTHSTACRITALPRSPLSWNVPRHLSPDPVLCGSVTLTSSSRSPWPIPRVKVFFVLKLLPSLSLPGFFPGLCWPEELRRKKKKNQQIRAGHALGLNRETGPAIRSQVGSIPQQGLADLCPHSGKRGLQVESSETILLCI